MDAHFSRVAGVYSDVRRTDRAPVHFIRDALDGAGRIMGADIGCGSGRYSTLLLECLEGLFLTCVDANRAMLDELTLSFGDHGLRNFKTVHARVEDSILEHGSIDCIFSFNAVHHFDFPAFLVTMRDCLKPGGQGFIYTRTPEQNGQTIWGQHFPGFLDMETRLYRLAEMKAWIGEAGGLDLLAVERFRYPRRYDLDDLLWRARNNHYSTFSLFPDGQFKRGLTAFEDNLRQRFADPAAISWFDENTLLHLRRGDAQAHPA